ncbi:MAG: hypothetical protein LAT68_17140 [Cyclobacteriaceae bacterium]|nr:hypothetical protein [Cyclobacteriaceae bacterium]
MILNRKTFLVIICIIQFFGCGRLKNKESECNNQIMLELMYLVKAKENIIIEKGIHQDSTLSSCLNIINRVDLFNNSLIELSGGFIDNSTELIDPCSVNDKSFEKFTDLRNDILMFINSEEEGGVFERGLKRYFLDDRYNEQYFKNNSIGDIAAEFYILQLNLYDLVLFPIE